MTAQPFNVSIGDLNVNVNLKPSRALGAGYIDIVTFEVANGVKYIEAVVFVDANEFVIEPSVLVTPPSHNMALHRTVPPNPGTSAHVEFYRLDHEWESGTDYVVQVDWGYHKSLQATAP